MTLREIIFSIREDYKLMSDDSLITDDYLAWLVKHARSVVMQQRYADPRNIIPPVEYQKFELAIGNNAISTTTIPSVIKTTGNANAPLKVYAKDIADTTIMIPINTVSLERLPFVGQNTWTRENIYCAVENDGSLILNSSSDTHKLVNKVVVRGVFEDPYEAYVLSESITPYYDILYPISDGILIDVRKILDLKLSQTLGINKDELNDGTEERFVEAPQGDK